MIEFSSLGSHTITILFNRISIPDTPIRILVESHSTSDDQSDEQKEIEVRGRSPHLKTSDVERGRSLSSEKILDPIHSRLSRSNETILQSNSSHHPTPSINDNQSRTERISKSEDRSVPLTRTMTPMNDLQIQKCHLLKEKFELQQPIDTVFGEREENHFESNSKRIFS